MFINARINMYKNEVNKIFLFFKHIFKIIYHELTMIDYLTRMLIKLTWILNIFLF